MSKPKKSKDMSKPKKSQDMPATSRMLGELRGESESGINRLEKKMNTGFAEVRSEFHDVRSEIHNVRSEIHDMESDIQEIKMDTHRTKFLVEELSRDVKAYMESFALVHEKQTAQDQRQSDLEKKVDRLELSSLK